MIREVAEVREVRGINFTMFMLHDELLDMIQEL